MGVQNEPFLPANQWQAQISYQYANANDFYVGDQRNDCGGRPSAFLRTRTVNLINLDVVYGMSNRLSLDLTVPFVVGLGRRRAEPGGRRRSYKFQAAGLGDISLQAEYWLSDPAMPSRVTGSVGLGFKAPTGSDNVRGR